MKPKVTVIGAGLAGCEAAWQLARRGVCVSLVEMKPTERTPAHSMNTIAELVCSNSLRGADLTSAVGLLKEELKRLGSLLVGAAHETRVPAGRALAVDRFAFSAMVEEKIAREPNIERVTKTADALPAGEVIVATGPLTAPKLAESLVGDASLLAYHDAIAPLVDADSLDFDKVFRASRYEAEEEGDYLNCPLDEESYFAFVKALILAEKTPLEDFETAPFFEGCLPVEEIAARGPSTLAHGPLKPVGLRDPRTGKRPFAVVQLRQEDAAGTSYNLVGFQTRLLRPEQRRVFRMIPGLEGARFERYGQVHRNSFVDAPQVLDPQMRLKSDPRITVAGQLSGVEGYVESIAGGYLAGVFTAARLLGKEPTPPPRTTALGGLLGHLGGAGRFQPSNVVWAMLDLPPKQKKQGKRQRRLAAAERALEELEAWKDAFER